MDQTTKIIAEHIGRWMGITIGPNRYAAMMRSMAQVAAELGWGNDPVAWGARLSRHPGADVLRVLAKHITIGETYFFREQPSVDFIRQIIAPEVRNAIAQNKTPYNIWTAACSTGEEPYSVVILLLEEIPTLSPAELQILATDINAEALNKARMASYREWSFRVTPPQLRERYFRREQQAWVISERVRSFVRFQIHNLVNDPYPFGPSSGETCQLILCRNVFIYFDQPTIGAVANKFFDILEPGGWLITSQVELNDELFQAFIRIGHSNGFFYRKPLTGRKNKQEDSQRPKEQIPSPTGAKQSQKLAGQQSLPTKKPTDTALKNKVLSDKSHQSGRGASDITTEQVTDKLAGVATEKTVDFPATSAVESQQTAAGLFRHALNLAEDGQTEQAVALLQQSLFLEPGNLETRFQYAHLLWKSGQTEESLKQYFILLRTLDQLDDGKIVFGGLSAAALRTLCNLAIQRHE
ncbi:MAG: tetratricopeptide repeat protein [Bacteroidetes bacterium]|nr:tetratricopeptide repeat protein [Bacteroidota bacterium]